VRNVKNINNEPE